MQFRFSELIVANLSLAGVLIQGVHASPGTSVETKNGIVNGFQDEAAPSVAQFLGIPYAQPPIGEQRWLPAQPQQPFSTLNALIPGPSCPQTDPPAGGGAWAPEFLIRPHSTSEDCLYLNIWAPSSAQDVDANPLPVVVWIHGGGFVEGSNDIAYQNPTQWVQRSQRHIVVAINYRLGLFGFPNAAGLDPEEQNLGILDQRLAMEWVRDNIAQFGGDPERIVLWGQSAGAASVSLHKYAYPDDPIAIAFIQNSGSSWIPIGSADSSQSNFSSLATAFGCHRGADKDRVDCLRKVPFDEIQRHVDQAGNLSFDVVIDEKTSFSDYDERTLTGRVAKGPLMTGTTRDEWSFASQGPPQPTNSTDVPADSIFGCPAHHETSLRTSAGLRTWRYMYSSNFTNIMPGGQGAFHSAELPLIFGTHSIARGNSSDFEYGVSDLMQDLWLAFIEDPEEGLAKHGWDATPPGGVDTTQVGVDIGFNGTLVQPYSWASWERACSNSTAV